MSCCFRLYLSLRMCIFVVRRTNFTIICIFFPGWYLDRRCAVSISSMLSSTDAFSLSVEITFCIVSCGDSFSSLSSIPEIRMLLIRLYCSVWLNRSSKSVCVFVFSLLTFSFSSRSPLSLVFSWLKSDCVVLMNHLSIFVKYFAF